MFIAIYCEGIKYIFVLIKMWLKLNKSKLDQRAFIPLIVTHGMLLFISKHFFFFVSVEEEAQNYVNYDSTILDNKLKTFHLLIKLNGDCIVRS